MSLDLLKETPIVIVSRLYPLWVALSLDGAGAGLAGLDHGGTWDRGAIWGLVWGGAGSRVFFVHPHHPGASTRFAISGEGRPFRSHDHSRNNALFGIIGLGRGMAQQPSRISPTSARHGPALVANRFSPWWVIQAMSAVGLASRVKVPQAQAMADKRVEKVPPQMKHSQIFRRCLGYLPSSLAILLKFKESILRWDARNQKRIPNHCITLQFLVGVPHCGPNSANREKPGPQCGPCKECESHVHAV